MRGHMVPEGLEGLSAPFEGLPHQRFKRIKQAGILFLSDFMCPHGLFVLLPEPVAFSAVVHKVLLHKYRRRFGG